ncbi:MAG: ABC transporter ATP-binding protein [Planctomycetota bacterium]|nr:ABC transporter ATP-binding protein [Planctomycetota bacterium]
MSETPSIALTNVSKWYGEVMGLNDVSVEFGPGVSGLLGPNGAGKSTMLKVITGMLRPNLGTALVCGRKPFDNPGVMRRVGLVPEQDAFYPHAAILDVITYLTRLQGYDKAESRRRAMNNLERVGLGHVMDRSAAGFSKGMRQRAKLAQALAHDPDVLVLDEPLNGLDPTGRREYAALIRALGDEGKCVLVSSHILHEVALVARRLVVLHNGRVLAEGTAREIREDLSEYPLTVHVQTQDGEALAPLIVSLEGVGRIEHAPTGLIVRTTQPNRLFDEIGAMAAEGKVTVEALDPVDEDLEAVFRYLTQ